MASLDVASDSTLQATNAALQEIAEAINNSGSGGISNLDDLDDVVVMNPVNGQTLRYSSSTGRWSNSADGSYVPTSKVIATLSACIQNTDISRVAGATALKELNTKVEGIAAGGNRRNRKNITNNIANLSTAITEQNLEKYGYSIGDYFVGSSGNYYVLADCDTFFGNYNNHALVTSHHLGVVVIGNTNIQWMDSKFTGWGYNRSGLRTYIEGQLLSKVKSDLNTLFGSWSSHLVSHDTLVTSAVEYQDSSWGWLSGTYITALTEAQVFGCPVMSQDKKQQGEGCRSLELFRKYNPAQIFGNVDVWLRSVGSETFACFVDAMGVANAGTASLSKRGVGLILFK